MKKQGSICEFSAERDAALVARFRRRLAEAIVVDMDRIFAEVAVSPAPRFFVTESRASLAIRHHRRHGEWDVKGNKRIEMYEEIERRVEGLMAADARLKFEDALTEVIYSPAPEFYITPRSCRTLTYKALNRAKLEYMCKLNN